MSELTKDAEKVASCLYKEYKRRKRKKLPDERDFDDSVWNKVNLSEDNVKNILVDLYHKGYIENLSIIYTGKITNELILHVENKQKHDIDIVKICTIIGTILALVPYRGKIIASITQCLQSYILPLSQYIINKINL